LNPCVFEHNEVVDRNGYYGLPFCDKSMWTDDWFLCNVDNYFCVPILSEFIAESG